MQAVGANHSPVVIEAHSIPTSSTNLLIDHAKQPPVVTQEDIRGVTWLLQNFKSLLPGSTASLNRGVGRKARTFQVDLIATFQHYKTNNPAYEQLAPAPFRAQQVPHVRKAPGFLRSVFGAKATQGESIELGSLCAGALENSPRAASVFDRAFAGSGPLAYEALLDGGALFDANESQGADVAGLSATLRSVSGKNGVTNSHMVLLLTALGKACEGNPADALAALNYLGTTDLAARVGSAYKGAHQDSVAHHDATPSAEEAAWRTAQLLAATPLGMGALRAVAKNEASNETYDFHEPVLGTFLRACAMALEREARSPLPRALLESQGSSPKLLHDGLKAAAKRLAFGAGKASPQTAAGNTVEQPDLVHLSWQEKYAYAMVRNGYACDDAGSRPHAADQRTTKAIESWVERASNRFNPFHKSPLSHVTNDGLDFMNLGGIREYRSVYPALSALSAAFAASIDASSALSETQQQRKDSQVRDAVRAAIVDVWNERILWETYSGDPYTRPELDRIAAHLQARLDRASATGQSLAASGITMQDLIAEFELRRDVQISPDLLQAWWNDLKGDAGPQAATVCANENDFMKALAAIRGAVPLESPWPASFQGMSRQQARNAIAAAFKSAWSRVELSSFLKVKDSRSFGVTSKNFLYHAFAVVKGAGVVQARPAASYAHSKQGIVSLGMTNDSANVSFLKRTAATGTGGFGVFGGPRLKVAGHGVTAGAGIDASYSREAANSEGAVFRMSREGAPARGGYGGRPPGLGGDPQLVREMGDVCELLFKGVTDAEKAEGMTPMKKALSTYPDHLSITCLSTSEDSDSTGISLVKGNGGASLSLGPLALGPSAIVAAGRRNGSASRHEEGGAIALRSESTSALTQVSAGLGTGSTSFYKVSDTELQGVGSVDASYVLDLYLGGKSEQCVLAVVDGEVTGNSFKRITHATRHAFIESVTAQLDQLAELMAARTISALRNTRESTGGEVTDGERQAVVDAAKQKILHYLEQTRGDLSEVQSFIEFLGLTPQARNKINQHLAMANLLEKAGDAANAGRQQAAIEAVQADPGSWTPLYGLVGEAQERTTAWGVNIGFNFKRQSGEFASFLKSFIVYR